MRLTMGTRKELTKAFRKCLPLLTLLFLGILVITRGERGLYGDQLPS